MLIELSKELHTTSQKEIQPQIIQFNFIRTAIKCNERNLNHKKKENKIKSNNNDRNSSY